MGKRIYRAEDVKAVDADKLAERLSGVVVVGIDVAKERQYASLLTSERELVTLVQWSHPMQTQDFVGFCKKLANAGLKVEVVMEPSGTYGDALRSLLIAAGFEVFRLAGKRVRDAAEVYDGVPSMHDAKAAILIARLHLDKASAPWPTRTDSERTLAAQAQVVSLHRERLLVQRSRLDALMARYWPELTRILSLRSMTLLKLLATYGGPAPAAADERRARRLMTKTGRSFLTAAVIDSVLKSAASTLGVAMLPAETELVKAMAKEAIRARAALAVAKKALTHEARKLLEATMVEMVGVLTAAMLIASGVVPTKYESAGALQKAMGLNLREYSSGTKKGGLHISKRGDAVARQVLFLAALRLIRTDPVVAAWYRKKVARDGGKRKRLAVVAVMRKLALALWHVGRGRCFDATKLFRTDKLDLPATHPNKEAKPCASA